MIVGVGVDLCATGRFGRSVRRPGFAERVFTPAELDQVGFEPARHTGEDAAVAERLVETLAGRFAVKEALAKALGAPAGLSWTDCEVLADDTGRPAVRWRGTVQTRMDAVGVRHVHVSISHDGEMAVGMVVCEA